MADNPCDIEISGGHLADFMREGIAEIALSSAVAASVLAFGLAVTTIDTGHVVEVLTSTKGIQVLEVGHVADITIGTLHAVNVALDKSRARDRVYQGLSDLSVDLGHVGDMLSGRVPNLVNDRAQVEDFVHQAAIGTAVTIDKAKVRDFFVRRATELVADSGHLADFAQQSARRSDSVLEHVHISDLLLSSSSTVDTEFDLGHVGDLLTGVASTSQVVIDSALVEGWAVHDSGSIVWTADCGSMGMSCIQAKGLQGIALLQGNLIGCSAEGLHAFTGPSSPCITTGVTDYGNSFEKRAGYVYVGYSGQPLTITVTVAQEGNPASYGYPMPARTANYSSPGRAKLGRGLRSRYWQFALSGPQFTLNDVELVMDTTSRKI